MRMWYGVMSFLLVTRQTEGLEGNEFSQTTKVIFIYLFSACSMCNIFAFCLFALNICFPTLWLNKQTYMYRQCTKGIPCYWHNSRRCMFVPYKCSHTDSVLLLCLYLKDLTTSFFWGIFGPDRTYCSDHVLSFNTLTFSFIIIAQNTST